MEHSEVWQGGSRRVACRSDRRWWAAASAPLYDRFWTEPLSARLAEKIVELSGPAGRRVLLAGAALPALADALAEAGHRVVALGPQPPSAATPGPAASRPVTARRVGARRAITWLGGEIEDLPLLERSVDLVVAVNFVYAQARPAVAAMRLAGLLAAGGRLICTGPGERAGGFGVARAERRIGRGWGTVCAHTAGRLTVEALDALTANRRGRSLALAMRAAADAYKLDVHWVEVPQAKQTLAILDRTPALTPGLPGLPVTEQPAGRGWVTAGD
ncbi:hypothetical protein GCM10023322_72390 [Rugosimonospora acidiphila]|uniref:Methyltransferase type 11 domain-containing protein n=1 Tax=Rugosimonospora acidiphila TaxID=556531 RepID=A0ABP9SPZ6_9ACTN